MFLSAIFLNKSLNTFKLKPLACEISLHLDLADLADAICSKKSLFSIRRSLNSKYCFKGPFFTMVQKALRLVRFVDSIYYSMFFFFSPMISVINQPENPAIFSNESLLMKNVISEGKILIGALTGLVFA